MSLNSMMSGASRKVYNLAVIHIIFTNLTNVCDNTVTMDDSTSPLSINVIDFFLCYFYIHYPLYIFPFVFNVVMLVFYCNLQEFPKKWPKYASWKGVKNYADGYVVSKVTCTGLLHHQQMVLKEWRSGLLSWTMSRINIRTKTPIFQHVCIHPGEAETRANGSLRVSCLQTHIRYFFFFLNVCKT